MENTVGQYNGDRYNLCWERLRVALDNNNVDDLLQLLVEIKEVPELSDMVVTVKRCIGQLLAQQESPTEEHAPFSPNSSKGRGEGSRHESFEDNEQSMNLLLENLKKNTWSPSEVNGKHASNDSVFDAFMGNRSEPAGEIQIGQLETNENGDATFVMEILPAVVGWVIGRAGSRIKEIQAQTNCCMWIDQEVPNDQPRKLYFHGLGEAIELAVALVKDLIETAPVIQANKIHQNYERNDEDGEGVCSAVVDCPIDRVGLLIGRKGWVIKKIMQESGAQVSINQSVREGCDRKIIISGSKHAVMTAEQFINGVIKSPVDTVHDFYNMDPSAPPAQFGVTKNFAPFIPPNSLNFNRFSGYNGRKPNMPPAAPPVNMNMNANMYGNNGGNRGNYPTAKGVLAAAYAATNANLLRHQKMYTNAPNTFQHPMTAAINASKMSNGYNQGGYYEANDRGMYGGEKFGNRGMNKPPMPSYMNHGGGGAHVHHHHASHAPPPPSGPMQGYPGAGYHNAPNMMEHHAAYPRNLYGKSSAPATPSPPSGFPHPSHISYANYVNTNY